MKIRSRKILEAALLAGAVAGLGVWGWSVVSQRVYEDWNNWIFDRQQAHQGGSLADYLHDRFAGSRKEAEKTHLSETSPARVAPRRPEDGNLLGRLKIPRLRLSAVVREGTGEKTLSLALGHVSGTARPGQNGNVGVAGHRDSLFRGLRNIKLNDRIVFETADGDTYVYQVSGTRIVKPTEVSVLNAGLYPELTLVTCYPFNYIGSAPERFIVKARQIGQTTRELNATEMAQTREPAQESPAAPLPQAEPAQAPQATPMPAPARASLKTGPRRVPFEVSMNHSRQLAPGISIGLTRADVARKTVDGWMWVMPERRTIWLRDQSAREPIVVHGADGIRREVVIDAITPYSMRGYLTL